MKNIIDDISFENSRDKLGDISKFEKNTGFKIAIIYIIGLIMTVPSFQSSWIAGVLNIMVLTLILFYYFKKTINHLFLKYYEGKFVTFLFVQVIWTFFLASIKTDGQNSTSSYYYYYFASYMIIVGLIIFFYCRNRVKQEASKLQLTTVKSNFVLTRFISKILVISVIVIIAGTQLFRVFRGTVDVNKISNGSITINNPFLGVIVLIILVISVISIILIVSLLPTLMFNPKLFVQKKLLEKYSEEFRNEYGYSKEQWYGEDV